MNASSLVNEKFKVTLTDGAVSNGYVNISKNLSFFPPEYLADDEHSASQQFVLNLPDGSQINTCALRNRKRIKARFNSLFKQLKLKGGDQLVLIRLNQGVYQMQLSQGYNSYDEGNSDSNDLEESMQKGIYPLNQIFFGPPGTGKTYITIEAAVSAAEPGFVWQHRDDLKARYDQLVAAGRIRFVTFHQSYSYEDFVEGLAASSTDGKISYEKKLGVFRKLVNAARDYRTTEVRKASESFTDCWQAFIQQLDESPAGVAVKTKRSQFVINEVEDNTIRFDKNQGNSIHTLVLSTLQAVFEGQRIVHGGLQPYYDALIAHIRELGQQLSATEVVRQNYVLVIDEINRGNISRIFGELITLIEPSKRIGAPEALEVTLPLTGDKFGVPDNLYIIGTMNTADRSLAGLDLALRRRFTFVEMPPKPALLDGLMVDGIAIGDMLRVMNQRITALLDRDHCIGHAYFMPLLDNPSLPLLADIFAQNILPLLQEYFFEDWQRIRWVLADQTKPDDLAFVVKDMSMDAQQLFPSVQQFKARDCWRLNHNALLHVEAYQRIYQASQTTSEQLQ